MPTPIPPDAYPEMIEAIHKHVKASDKVVRHRSGYPVYKRYIGVCLVEAYTEDSGYTHGIVCDGLIHAFNTHGHGYTITLNDEETLISLYRLMVEGI
jgi:hypothetical protein